MVDEVIGSYKLEMFENNNSSTIQYRHIANMFITATEKQFTDPDWIR